MLALFSVNVSIGLLAAFIAPPWALLLIATLELALACTLSPASIPPVGWIVAGLGLQIGYCISIFAPLLTRSAARPPLR